MRRNRYTGQFLIEPNQSRPPINMMRTQQQPLPFKAIWLGQSFKLNLEANHATLAGHTFEHELRMARVHGLLGSVDANQGDPLLGWDTDEFPTDLYSATLAMCGNPAKWRSWKRRIKLDAKVRRSSFEPDDCMLQGWIHLQGLKAAHKLIEDRVFEDVIQHRYRSLLKGLVLKLQKEELILRHLSNMR